MCILIVGLLGTIVVFGLFMNAYLNAPARMDALTLRVDALNKKPSQILSSDGKVLFRVSTQNRVVVKLEDIPVMTRNAMIAAEDKRFYEHSGVDFIGLARSMRSVAETRSASQGGSTLTMQLAKLLSDGSQKTLSRKIDDAALAIYMERQMTKDQILEMYLNTVYFGEGAFGIAAAARVYFDKDLKDLTIGESAMLARCVRRPINNPIHNLAVATENRNIVLGVMKSENMIDDSQYQAAIAEKPKINPHPQKTTATRPNGAEYFVDDVLAQFKSEFPDADFESGGYTIETTLDSRIQKRAEQAVKENVNRFRSYKVNTAVIIVIDREGQILAEVGGSNYRRHNFNAATHGLMPPGSGFKPIVYAGAFRDGVLNSVDDMVSNAPIYKRDPSVKGGVWIPHNDSKSDNRPRYTVRTAVADSINLCAIHTIEALGPEKVVEYAHDNFGIRSKLEAVDPLALGASAVSPEEMAEAYSVFMLKGDRVRPYGVKRIVGPDDQVLREYQPQFFRGVWDPAICAKIDTLLEGVVHYGTAALRLPDGTFLANDIPDARGKTGTNGHTDCWFDGYADGLLAIGWCGNEQKDSTGTFVRRNMGIHAFGGTVTVPIWRDVMQYALKVRPQAPIVEPTQDNDQKAEKAAGAKFGGADDGDSNATDDGPSPDQSIQTPTPVPTSPPGDSTDPTSAPAAATPAPIATPQTPPPAQPATTDAPVPNAPQAKKSDQTEYVEVEICDATGLKATMYCPETTTRRFKKGTEPKKYCNVHTGNQDGRP